MLVQNSTANSDVVISIRWHPTRHFFIHPKNHKDILLSLVGMMEIKSILESNIHQMAFGWLELYLNRSNIVILPILEPRGQCSLEVSFRIRQQIHIDNFNATISVLLKLVFNHKLINSITTKQKSY